MQNVILLIIIYYEKQIFPYTSTQVHKYTLSAFAFLLSVFILFACNSQKQELVPVVTQNAETGVQYKFIDLEMPRAVAYLEELMNYDVAKPHNAVHNIKIDSIRVDIPVQWNEKDKTYSVSAENLHDAFNRLHHDVLDYNTRLDWGKQASHVVAVDLPEWKDANFDAEQKTFSISVQTWTTNDEEVTNVGGKIEQATIECSTTKSWSFYNVGCTGTNVGNTRAETQITTKVNDQSCNPHASCKGWYSNVQHLLAEPCEPMTSTCNAYKNPNGAPYNDYYMDQYLFIRPYNWTSCLTPPAEVNFYVTGAAIAGNIRKPVGDDVIAYDVYNSNSLGSAFMMHSMYITTGTCTMSPPQP